MSQTTDAVLNLLVRWEELRREGKSPSVEELCPGDESLQRALRDRIAKRERMQGMFDLPGEATVHETCATPGSLPRVPGYAIDGLIGRGGMGVVYRATQTALNRPVALKMVLSGASAGPDERNRFRTEAEAVARLQHPNIVQIFEVGEASGCPYLALEYVGGGSLAEYAGGKPLPPRRAAELVLDLARAVAHAHQLGILHRDLKPANVLLTADGTPKIADFGLAKRMDTELSHTQTGAVLGSPSYMAPEQAEGKVRALAPATDVYALGAILYELLTGRPPFLGATFLETIEQVRFHDPASPRLVQPQIPKDLEVICLKCLEKAPAQRYTSAADLAKDLERFLEGEPIEARVASWTDQLTRLLRNNQVNANFSAWGSVTLWVAPIPFLVHLAVYLLFRARPEYPVVAIGTSMATVLCVLFVVFVSNRRLLRLVPGAQRRQIVSVWLGHLIGFTIIPLTVVRMIGPESVEEWFIVYALWATEVGVTFFALASNAGFMYVIGTACFLLAILMPWIYGVAPLLVGLLMTTNMTAQGLFLRGLGRNV